MVTRDFLIFYTDDDEDDQQFFTDVVNGIDDGIQIRVQSDGKELLNTLQDSEPKPDLVFLDLNMPVKNGFAVLKEMRHSDELSSIPVIVFSTSDNAATIESCKALGADIYITKPTSYKDMTAILKSVLVLDWRAKPKIDRFYFTSKNA